MDRQLQSSIILISLLSHLFQTVSNYLTHEKTCNKEIRDNSVAEDNPKTRRPHQPMPSTAKGPGTIKPIPDLMDIIPFSRLPYSLGLSSQSHHLSLLYLDLGFWGRNLGLEVGV